MENQAFEPFRGREAPAPGDRVRVYRNLNRMSRFSVLAMDGPEKGKVLGYARCVELESIQLKVSEKLRDRLLREQIRNVHAYAEGRFVGTSERLPETFDLESSCRITYQPFVRNCFFSRENPNEPVWKLARAWFYGADLVSFPE